LAKSQLEAVFGGPLDAAGITDAAVQRLVAEQTPESEVLEFKQALWSRSPRPRPPWTEEQEFAKDVGALANHRGGVLLVGVSEVGGVATSIAPFSIVTSSEAEERRLRQALVNDLAPPANTEFVWIPTINGEWLSEAEVAERYRRRFLAHADEAVRVEQVVARGQDALRSASGVWLFAAAIPELPVAGVLDQETVDAFEEWHRSSLQVSPSAGPCKRTAAVLPLRARWAAQIVAWHRSHVTNGPTEAVNNLAKRIKRVAFGLVNFRHHRVRCLLYAGKPDWTLLPTIQP